jgi:hypothetical protein
MLAVASPFLVGKMSSSIVQDEDNWSDEPEEEEEQVSPLQPRAYQIEMFEQSMKENIIATVTTDKSMILERS